MTITESPEWVGPKSTETEPDRIVVIEYQSYRHGWEPCAVVTERHSYDFSWCPEEQVLCQELTGGGAGQNTWELYRLSCAPKIGLRLWYDHFQIALTHEGKPISDADARSLGYQVIRLPIDGNPFDDAIEEQVQYCTVCGHDHPDNSMCRHVQWDDGGNGWSLGCGAESLNCGETQASLYRLLRLLPSGMVQDTCEQLLRSKSVYDVIRVPRRILHEPEWEQRYWRGIAWLKSLDRRAKKACALTAGWIWAFLRERWAACCIVPDATFIRQLPRAVLDEWLALDPMDPTALEGRSLRVRAFKPRCRNDHLFLQNPQACHEVILALPYGSWKKGPRELVLSVASVERVGKKTVEIRFAGVISRNCQHISQMDGYETMRLCEVNP